MTTIPRLIAYSNEFFLGNDLSLFAPDNNISGDFDRLTTPPSARFRGSNDVIKAKARNTNIIAGDAREAQALDDNSLEIKGGNDRIKSLADDGSNFIQGDLNRAEASGGGRVTIKGGNDKIIAVSNSTFFPNGEPVLQPPFPTPSAANVVTGDLGFAQVSGAGSSVNTWGGNDHIKAVAKNGGNVIAGDVGAAVAFSGARVNIRSGRDVINSFSVGESELAGDVGTAIALNSIITIESDNDRIISQGSGNDQISGDILQAFGNVTVTAYGNDYIVAGGGNDQVFGDYDPAMVNDAAATSGGNDVLVGVDLRASMPGTLEVDVLWGNGGEDTFVLGDRHNFFYLGHGISDLAFIKDFGDQEDQDWIQLKWGGGSNGFKSYSFDQDGNDTKISFQGDLIAVVEGATMSEVENRIVWA
ncbi:hypothetical protein [Pleurocapsa sp. PCC 7319]|uniref:hypothetical protein n=1 Tax=Pleurocapsa sp. PCC 7319 TaxID=118161 RepID=UPI0003453569|nr:hypothetical protein [Pleurocapsa sp. PCC 7319]